MTASPTRASEIERPRDSAPPPRPSGGFATNLWLLARSRRYEGARPTFEGLRYLDGRRRGRPPLCDVYLPDGGGPHPSIVIAHGGGGVIGSRRMTPVRLLATRLRERGRAVCAVDYRLLFRGGGLDEALDDVGAAVAWWRGEAARFGLDPARTAILGISAGAALALLHAGAAPEGTFDRVVGVHGVYDFEWVRGALATLLRRLLIRGAGPEAWAGRSATRNCRTASPVLLVHGRADAMTPIGHAERLIAARAEKGLATETFYLDGGRHGFLNDADGDDARRAVEAIADFLG